MDFDIAADGERIGTIAILVQAAQIAVRQRFLAQTAQGLERGQN